MCEQWMGGLQSWMAGKYRQARDIPALRHVAGDVTKQCVDPNTSSLEYVPSWRDMSAPVFNRINRLFCHLARREDIGTQGAHVDWWTLRSLDGSQGSGVRPQRRIY